MRVKPSKVQWQPRLVKRLDPFLIQMEMKKPDIEEKRIAHRSAETHSDATEGLTALLRSRDWLTVRLAHGLIGELNQDAMLKRRQPMENKLSLQEKIILGPESRFVQTSWP
jgi:hypothetical protein